MSSKSSTAAIHWFRKGLRLHDNPALLDACQHSHRVYPVFVMDPFFSKPDIIGVNRYSFLLESLQDLDINLRKLGSRLYVVRGKPEQQLPLLVQRWNVNLLTFEKDSSSYSVGRDAQLTTLMQQANVQVRSHASHTLRDLEQYVAAAAKSKQPVPTHAYQTFCKLFDKLGKPRSPCESISSQHFSFTRELSSSSSSASSASSSDDSKVPFHDPADPLELLNSAFDVPTLAETAYHDLRPTTPFRGGETEALARLQRTVVERAAWVAAFEKPATSPNALQPSTTVLSVRRLGQTVVFASDQPYLKFGCLSASRFYHEIDAIYTRFKGKHSQPPVSLHGQLLWREFFYLASATTPNFSKMVGNPRCRQIPWSHNPELIDAFKNAKTGFPFIDAIMTQLRLEGWIHHLARHAVACFLTRGDLWQSWEAGVKVFDLYLLDSDWALNNANWQWLSCSNWFYQYFRCYSPIAFGKKTDPNGDYIRKYVPQLSKFPAKYIFEPWKAPLDVQKSCGCLIGKDYPMPIVDHDEASQRNMQRIKEAYAAQAASGNASLAEDSTLVQESPSSSSSSSFSSSIFKASSKAGPSIIESLSKASTKSSPKPSSSSSTSSTIDLSTSDEVASNLLSSSTSTSKRKSISSQSNISTFFSNSADSSKKSKTSK